MTIPRTTLEKMYWLLVACVPLLPVIVLLSYERGLACTDGDERARICFEYGTTFFYGADETVFLLSIALLWPVCIWRLIGKQIFRRIRALRPSADGRWNLVAIVLEKTFWLVAATIPLWHWRLHGMRVFGWQGGCEDIRTCIPLMLPLDGRSVATVLLACLLLWPMSIWKLIGSYFDENPKG